MTELAAIAPDVESQSSWAAKAVHKITLESGAVVKIRIPDLTLLLAADAVPEQLKAIALDQILKAAVDSPVAREAELAPAAVAAGETASPEAEIAAKQRTFADLADLYHYLVSEMLVEPELSPEDLAVDSPNRPPAEDIALLIDIARRVRDTDARGVKLGVMPLSRFATFRDAHGCAEGCEGCSSLIARVSTALQNAV